MITHKQLSLAEVLKISKIISTMTDTCFFLFLMKPLTLMKLFLFLLFPIFTPEPEDHASTSFILAQGTSIPAYFLNPDRHAPDCVFEVLSGIV